jgi:hypothetical protein
MADISCLADDYWLPVGVCSAELVKGAPALNRFVVESVKLTLTTMPHLFELMSTGVFQMMDNKHITTEQRQGYSLADLLVKSHTERPCVALPTYRLWGPNELSPNHRV